jgi:hypothetical protein
MLQELLAGGEAGDDPDPLGRSADHRAGARAILTGIAANHSFAAGQPVRVKELLEPEAWSARAAP